MSDIIPQGLQWPTACFYYAYWIILSPYTLCDCIDLRPVHHPASERYQQLRNKAVMLLFTVCFCLFFPIYNVVAHGAPSGAICLSFLSFVDSIFLLFNNFWLSIICPEVFFFLVDLPFLSLSSFTATFVLTFSLSTLSSFSAYWFVPSIRSSTWIQTRPFAWLPINI